MNILCGYNVNIDSVYRIGGAELSELLEAFESSEILGKIDSPPGRIDSVSDFVAGLAYCMKNGCGAEWLVFNPSVFDFLKGRYFGKSLVRMGGNAGIMANTLSELGASMVVPNVAVPSETQLSLFSRKNIYFPGNSSGAAGKERSKAGTEDDTSGLEQEPIHFVFDFSEGESFSLDGQQFTVPRENRFIATCDHLNFRLFINPNFDLYSLQHAGEMDGALISGFHLLIEEYPDGGSYTEIVDKILTRVLTWRAVNRILKVHLEFGHFANREIAFTVFSKFSGIVNSVGMNEDELASFYELHRVPAEELRNMNSEAVGTAASCLASSNGLDKLFVHTREFVMTVVKLDEKSSHAACGSPEKPEPERENLSHEIESKRFSREIERELIAMDFGVRCAGTYAALGKLDGRNLLKTGVSKLQESEPGKRELSRFLAAFKGQYFGNGAFAFRGGYLLCMLPTMLSKSPVTTVGLGDTLTAATFLRRLELDVQA